MAPKLTVYSFVGSQWAGVVHLALAEKGFSKDEYTVKEVDLVKAENFDPKYLEVNTNGTIPSLVSSSLDKPLVESTDILRYLDSLGTTTLAQTNPQLQQRTQDLINLVHSGNVDTNVILLNARDPEEMERKAASPWKDFVQNRQTKLDEEHEAGPETPFYRFKRQENAALYRFYSTSVGRHHQEFFERSHAMYRAFATGMNKLENLLVLPYAAGDSVTEADFHVVPWLAHAMWGADTESSEIHNFGPLESLIQKSEPGFSVGPRTREWWRNIAAAESFQTVYPTLH
ncbi:hypothetical protein FZEAL_877 [Fusarium zealandicum]|uniref:Glutathione S-transferase n=1 Tax=Fusarium zealandicum TaxID=1053134 RepID=A0A8H4XPB2_9HYPO|nr:hypothetical protein FZEAL_877 [Fusarium zealandicum]